MNSAGCFDLTSLALTLSMFYMKRIFHRPLADMLTALQPVAAADLVSRITAPAFTDMIAEREALRQVTHAEQERYKAKPCVLDLEARRSYHKAFNRQKALDKRLGLEKDIHAEMVNGLFAEPAEHPLPVPANAWAAGTFPSGSSEWLRQRQPTVGGSDVGAVLRMDPEYGGSNYSDVRQSKLDRDPQTQDHVGAAARGDVWEPALVSALGVALADLGIPGELFINKTTYTNGDQHANLDGFLVEDGEVVAIAECKTSSFPAEWTESMIPYGYVLQTQHYMEFFGLELAYLVVNIDDMFISVYEISAYDTIPSSEWAAKAIAKEEWGMNVREVKEMFLDGIPSSLSELRYSQTKGIVTDLVKKWDRERALAPAAPRRNVFKITTWVDKWFAGLEKGFVFLDLETSGMSPKSGHIIEIGAVRDDGATFDSLYGLHDEHIEWNGTGMVEIHRINVEDIAGKSVFIDDDAAIEALREFVGDRVIVAHNAMFEERWLSEIFPEFQYADTMHLFSALVQDSPNNKMSSLVAWAGLEYLNAHRAFADAKMMKEAFDIVLKDAIQRLYDLAQEVDTLAATAVDYNPDEYYSARYSSTLLSQVTVENWARMTERGLTPEVNVNLVIEAEPEVDMDFEDREVIF